MFDNLTDRLSRTLRNISGRGRLTEDNVKETLREVRMALLEADVALPVVQALIERIKVRAVGQEVLKSLTPGQALIKVVRDELTAVMGAQAQDLPAKYAEKGKVVVANTPNYPPMEYRDPATNELMGLDIDLGKALAARPSQAPACTAQASTRTWWPARWAVRARFSATRSVPPENSGKNW